jgi:hydrogenase maturation protein HypF
VRKRYAVAVTKNVATKESTAHDTSVLVLDAAPTFKAMLDDREAGVAVRGNLAPLPRCHGAARVVEMAPNSSEAVYGITHGRAVGRRVHEPLRGGAVGPALAERPAYTVALNRELPPNDGCVSYGQAVVARATSKLQGSGMLSHP